MRRERPARRFAGRSGLAGVLREQDRPLRRVPYDARIEPDGRGRRVVSPRAGVVDHAGAHSGGRRSHASTGRNGALDSLD